MFSLNKKTNTREPWTRRVFGVFVVVCLNLALQPCTMAMGAEQDDDCPHCPPSESQDHHGHHGSSFEPVDKTPCGPSADDCSLGDDLYHDGRNNSAKLKDLSGDFVIAVSSLTDIVPTCMVDLGGLCPTRSPPPGSFPPLNVLYCVYLD